MNDDNRQVIERLMTLQTALAAIAASLAELCEKLPATSGAAAERVSSAEVKTSARGVDIAVKSYAGSDVHWAVNEAVAEYQRAHELLASDPRGRDSATA
jgi:hypothetical protein